MQLAILLLNDKYQFSMNISWFIILISSVLIWRFAPVESINRELDREEKVHCKRVTLKVMIALLLLTGYFVAIVFISQCIGIIKYRAEKAL